MGFAMQSADFPVAKGTSGVLFLTKKETPEPKTMPCINCGMCIHACPMQLTPVLMRRDVDAGEIDLAKEKGLLDCIECGSCSFVCPSDIPLVQTFKVGKKILRDRKGK